MFTMREEAAVLNQCSQVDNGIQNDNVGSLVLLVNSLIDQE